jgi:hypothetical protein
VGIRFARPGTSRREEVGRSQGYSTASRHLIAESGIVTVLTAVEGGNLAGGSPNCAEALGKQGNVKLAVVCGSIRAVVGVVSWLRLG